MAQALSQWEYRWAATQPTVPKIEQGRFSSASAVMTFRTRGFEDRQTCCETGDFRTSRYVLTTDVSVNEGQAFIRDLVLVLVWRAPLARYGR